MHVARVRNEHLRHGRLCSTRVGRGEFSGPRAITQASDCSRRSVQLLGPDPIPLAWSHYHHRRPGGAAALGLRVFLAGGRWGPGEGVSWHHVDGHGVVIRCLDVVGTKAPRRQAAVCWDSVQEAVRSACVVLIRRPSQPCEKVFNAQALRAV